MGVSIHYKVKAKLIRFIKDGVIDFFEINEKFENDNPIEAREQAFLFYQNNIDVLLQGVDKIYISDKQTRVDLNSFVDSGRIAKQEGIFEGLKIAESYGNGIGVYMVIDIPRKDDVINDPIGEEYAIHEISFTGDDTDMLTFSLTQEYLYYEDFGYNTKDYKQIINYFEVEDNEVCEYTILKTPFDWTGLDIPYAVVPFESNEETDLNSIPLVNKLIDFIDSGEGNQIEFKSSLIAYQNENNVGYSRHIIFKIIKAIASFLNSNGGILFIGVKDDKSILGLENDFSLANTTSDNPKDYFKLQVDYIIKNNFKSLATFIRGDFVEIEDKLIYYFLIEPSPSPVFVKNTTDKDINNHKKEFYVRLTGASSIHYYDTEEIVNYCLNHWRK